MGRRWKVEDSNAIAEIRLRCATELAQQPAYPEVVGDRVILRFLRAKDMNLDQSTKLYRDFLLWRAKNSVDFIRMDILYGGKHSPLDFPHGRAILGVAPQIIITRHARDHHGQPLVTESYNFLPKDVLKAVTPDEYLHFLIYTLEFRSMVLEQLSHEMEEDYINKHPLEEDRMDGYGVVMMDITIRDMKGIGMAHLGADGRSIVSAALKAALPNYPEQLGKCHFVNVPWLFNSMWYFIKSMLDERVLSKIGLCGHEFMASLLEDLPIESIPTSLGGNFDLFNEPFDFNFAKDGPLYYDASTSDLAGIY